MMLFAIVGSTGSGKTTLIKRLIETFGKETICNFPSCTTRNMRQGEINGKDYFFLTKDSFKKSIESKDIIEYNENYGNMYGTSLDVILDFRETSKCLIKDYDVVGYKKAMQKINDSLEERCLPLFPIVSILIDADDKTLSSRMRGRNDNTNVDLREQELIKDRVAKSHNHYDHILDTTNMDIDTAFNNLCNIINSEYQIHYHKDLLIPQDGKVKEI